MSNKTRLSLATIFIIGLLCISLLLPDQEGSFSDKSVKNIILREYVDKIDEDQVSLNLELGTEKNKSGTKMSNSGEDENPGIGVIDKQFEKRLSKCEIDYMNHDIQTSL